MADKKVLLLYISEHSGHHCASRAIENALHEIDPSIRTMNINGFNYTNPILEKVINKTYMGVVRTAPELWDYLYDNPKVLKKTQKLRDMIHRFNSGKLKTLLDDFKPGAIICTQAFPCGMVADYKKSSQIGTPIIGVLTDYAPHSYWIYNNVDFYIVPSKETGMSLVHNGTNPDRIKEFGIPIDPRFSRSNNKTEIFKSLALDQNKPCILIMGGTQGLGPIKELVRLFDKTSLDIQMVIAAGTNKKLYQWLKGRNFRKKTIALPYADNVNELMRIATVIVTKPGGITTAEALAAGVPMLIVNPLPGQEAMNTRFLLSEGVAVKAEYPEDAPVILRELLYNHDKLNTMKRKASALAKPGSSMDVAKLIIGVLEK